MTSPAGSAQASQAGLAILLAADVSNALTAVDVHDLARTLPKLKLTIAGLVHRYGLAGGALAGRFYRQQRIDAGIPGGFTIKPADPAGVTQVDKAIGWATKDLWSIPGPSDVDVEGIVRTAEGFVQASAEKMVLDVGRDTIVDNVKRDPKARGWARIPEPAASKSGTCAFCILLATRGAIYKESTVNFRAHNGCQCHAEPIFTAYEPSAQIREWQALYASSTRSVSGKAKRNAFRKALAAQTA